MDSSKTDKQVSTVSSQKEQLEEILLLHFFYLMLCRIEFMNYFVRNVFQIIIGKWEAEWCPKWAGFGVCVCGSSALWRWSGAAQQRWRSWCFCSSVSVDSDRADRFCSSSQALIWGRFSELQLCWAFLPGRWWVTNTYGQVFKHGRILYLK